MTDRKVEGFKRVWKAPDGWRDWFASVNNQPYGNRFMAASFIFFALAGLIALLMRVQLALPDNNFMGPEVYNRLFTMHGSTMMYLVVLPFMEGLAIYLLPQFLGNREMAYPRMSAFSFWVFFSGGLVFFSGFLVDAVPDAGWFVYPPLSGSKYSGLGMDFLLVGLGFIEIAGVGAGVEITVTVLKFRSPGMSLGKMPLFAWAWLVTGFMIIFAFSTLLTATVLIELDRAAGTAFFDPERGGTPLLWQHLFWFFGHPDVYIMFLPATGIVSMIIPTFASRPIAGYPFVAVAILVTGFLSFGLWVHHMFTTGLPALSMGFFVAASAMIGLASGTQIFAWIATLWRRRPSMSSPMLFVMGFFFIFVLGGFTGVMVAVLPFDLQAHDTYFIVAHFHYVLIGGVVFPILAGVHYWMPLVIGRMLDERLAKWSFWLIFLGFNLAFFPMHISGFLGMARRIYTYPERLGIGWLNLVSSLSSFVIGAGFVLVTWNVYRSRKRGLPAPLNPWKAGTLEWSLTADAPNYVFLRPPVTYDRDPLWNPVRPEDRNERYEKIAEELEAFPSRYRATLVTDVVTGEPQAVQRVAGPTYIPVIAALGMLVMSVATLAQFYLAALAALVFTGIVVAVWLWPKDKELEEIKKTEIEKRTGLTLEPTGSASSGWWAMLGVLGVLGTVFAVLFYSYFYIRLYSPVWPQEGIALPGLAWPGAFYALLPLGWIALQFAERSRSRRSLRACVAALFATAALGFLHSGYLVWYSAEALPSLTRNAYSSIFHVTVWHLSALAAGGAGLALAGAVRIFRNKAELHRGYVVLQLEITRMYWGFTVGAGLLGYLILHLSPYLI